MGESTAVSGSNTTTTCVGMWIQITLKWIRIDRSIHQSRVVVDIPDVESFNIPYVTSSCLMIYQRKSVITYNFSNIIGTIISRGEELTHCLASLMPKLVSSILSPFWRGNFHLRVFTVICILEDSHFCLENVLPLVQCANFCVENYDHWISNDWISGYVLFFVHALNAQIISKLF